MLEPLINDPVNYVRQAALIASALVLIQQTEHTSSKVQLHTRSDVAYHHVYEPHQLLQLQYITFITFVLLCLHTRSALISVIQVKSTRETYSKVISDKHEDVMAKFGAILAQGIIDAGNNFFVL